MNADDVVQMFGLIDISHMKMPIYSSVNLSRILPSPFNIDIQTVAADPSACVELNVAVCNLSTFWKANGSKHSGLIYLINAIKTRANLQYKYAMKQAFFFCENKHDSIFNHFLYLKITEFLKYLKFKRKVLKDVQINGLSNNQVIADDFATHSASHTSIHIMTMFRHLCWPCLQLLCS